MRKIGFLALILAMFYSGIALAQVAAPKLNPIELNGSGIDLTHPVNPAVLPWNGPSSISVGAYDLDLEIVQGPITVTGTADGNVIQANMIGETFSFAVESSTLNIEIPDFNFTGEFKDTLVSLAGRMGESFALGLAQQSSESSEDTLTLTKTLPMIGGVLKLGESFYLGGTYGTETVERTVGVVSGEAERVVSRAGVGFFKKGNESAFHLEYYTESSDLLEIYDSTGTNKIYVEDSATTGLTLEVQFGSIYLGYEQITREFTEVDILASAYEEKEEVGTLISIGYAPMEGLQLLVSSVTTEITIANTGEVITLSGIFVGLGLAF